MKTVKSKKKSEEKNWAIPGVELTHEEFLTGIRQAEKGTFYTLEQVQKMRNQCRNSKQNQ
jgi:hypothetical protein